MNSVYSLGHSNITWDHFAGLLEKAEIATVIDVHSHPYSRFQHFGHPALQARLNALGLSYVYLGAELGGRPPSSGPSSYEAMAATTEFALGIERVLEIAPRTRSVLMCSEHEPLACHRCLLVGRRLVELGIGMRHVLRDGRIETQAELEDRLLAVTPETDADLFASRDERLSRAYSEQERRINRRRM